MWKDLAAILAGALAALIWQILGSETIVVLGEVAYRTMTWRVAQFLTGSLCAIAISLPAALLIRPSSARTGILYVAALLVTQFLAMLVTDTLPYLGKWASLPDTWAFVGASLVLFIWISRRNVVRRAA